MSSQGARRVTTRPPRGSGFHPRVLQFGLELNGKHFPLGYGTFLIGRGANADFRLDGPLVSRQHAALEVTEDGVTVEDLSSRNGVFVNGVLIQRRTPLLVGDMLRVGNTELRLITRREQRSSERAPAGARNRRTQPPTLLDLDEPGAADEPEPQTRHADPLAMLSSIVDRALAEGNAAEAESIISGHLSVLLNEARLHRDLKAETCVRASEYALKLARETGKGSWVDYVFELHGTARRVMSLSVIHELYSVAPYARVTNPRRVGQYITLLRSLDDRYFGPDRELILKRLQRFGRL